MTSSKSLRLTAASLASLLFVTTGAKAQDGVRATYFRRDFVQWGFGPEKARLDGITHLFYMGPSMDFSTGQMIGDLNDPDLAELRRRCRLSGTKIIGCLPGGAPAFAMISNSTLRAAAAQSLAKWCREARLDGIDTDFEHPASAADRANYSTFMSDLRAALGPRPILSSAVAYVSSAPSISAAMVNDKMDLVNVMSYDHGGEHATLASANSDMNYYRDQKMLPSKLILGVPFYGTHVTNRDQKSYAGILASYDNNPDPSVNSLGGYYFNGRDLIRTKSKLSMEKGGGVFTWIMDHDVTDGRSLLTAMKEGADQGQATMDGFEYPAFADPNAVYTRNGATLSSTTTRSEGLYGLKADLYFNGAAWADTQIASPTFAPISFPSGAAIHVDLQIPGAGLLGTYFYLYDNLGRRARLDRYGLNSTGWRGLWFPRSEFVMLDGAFDFNSITKWMMLFMNSDYGGAPTTPSSRTIVLDNLALYAPGAARPVRTDVDADRDGVPDVCLSSGNVVWQDRFRHPAATDPKAVYSLTDSPAYQWQWKDAAYGAQRRVLSGVMNFDSSGYATCLVTSPKQQPFAVNSSSVLHFELDVLQEMPAGTLIVDVLDDTGAYRRMLHYSVLQTKGLKLLDLPMSDFTGTADLSRITGWRIYFEGHGASSAPHTGAVDIADIAWGKLPAGSQPLTYDLDADGDGLTILAEDRNANGLVDAGETDTALADSDGDGTTDGAEVRTGTSPVDSSSIFQASLSTDENDQTWIEWPSKPGARYDVMESPGLTTWSVAFPDVPASSGTTTRLQVQRPATAGFFKVLLRD